MRCTQCGSEDIRVIDSRPIKRNRRKRKYECGRCHNRFQTIEYTFEDVARLDELFEREKDIKALLDKIIEIAEEGKRI